jgi:hypothetical protein
MEVRTETSIDQCCVDNACKLAPCNFCIMCRRYACDNHMDARTWRTSDGIKSTTGLICLGCVPGNTEIRNSPQPVKETSKAISLEDCMRLQRVLENLE